MKIWQKQPGSAETIVNKFTLVKFPLYLLQIYTRQKSACENEKNPSIKHLFR